MDSLVRVWFTQANRTFLTTRPTAHLDDLEPQQDLQWERHLTWCCSCTDYPSPTPCAWAILDRVTPGIEDEYPF